GWGSGNARPICDRNLLRRRGATTRSFLRRRWALAVRFNASEHERSSSRLTGSEAHIAFVDKADRASRIERVGIENLLIRRATRSADRLLAWRCDHPDCRTAAGEARRTGRPGRTSGTGRTSATFGWRLALAAGGQEKGGQDHQKRKTHESPDVADTFYRHCDSGQPI